MSIPSSSPQQMVGPIAEIDTGRHGAGPTLPAVFRHVFDNAGVAHLKDSLMDHWEKAWQRHTCFKIDQLSTFTQPPKASAPVNGVTTIMVPGWSEEPRSEAEKAQLLADPEWVQHMSEMGFDPTHATFTSSDFHNTTELRPMEFRIRDLGGTRAEFVATCWDADLEPFFHAWLNELASLWSEAAPAIDQYLGREGIAAKPGDNASECVPAQVGAPQTQNGMKRERRKQRDPTVPGRNPEYATWVATYRAVEGMWKSRKIPGKDKAMKGTYELLADWLKSNKPELACGPKTLAKIIKAGDAGQLKYDPEVR